MRAFNYVLFLFPLSPFAPLSVFAVCRRLIISFAHSCQVTTGSCSFGNLGNSSQDPPPPLSLLVPFLILFGNFNIESECSSYFRQTVLMSKWSKCFPSFNSGIQQYFYPTGLVVNSITCKCWNRRWYLRPKLKLLFWSVITHHLIRPVATTDDTEVTSFVLSYLEGNTNDSNSG